MKVAVLLSLSVWALGAHAQEPSLPLTQFQELLAKVREKATCPLITTEDFGRLEADVLKEQRNANNNYSKAACGQEIRTTLGQIDMIYREYKDRRALEETLKGQGAGSAVVVYGGKTFDENLQEKLSVLSQSLKVLSDQGNCKDRVSNDLLAAAGLVSTFSPQGAFLSSTLFQAGRAVLDALKSFRKGPVTIVEKINLCRANELMKSARGHLCSVAQANVRVKTEVVPWYNRADGTSSAREAAEKIVAHTIEVISRDPNYQLLTALDSAEASLKTLSTERKDRDRRALRDLKESLDHLIHGLRCSWRNGAPCADGDRQCQAVIDAPDKQKAINKNRCKAFSAWREALGGPLFSEDPGNSEGRKKVLSELREGFAGGYFSGIKNDIEELSSNSGPEFSPMTGTSMQPLQIAWAIHEKQGPLGPESNVLEGEDVGIKIAREASTYLPDLSHRSPDELAAMCSAIPCLWSQGRERKVSPYVERPQNAGELKISSGYSPMGFQDPASLAERGVIPGLQGKGDLGFSKLVGTCKARYPNARLCEVQCGVSFWGRFCEPENGDCEAGAKASTGTLQEDVKTPPNPAPAK